MNRELNKKIRRTEFFSGLALTIVLGLSVVIGSLLRQELWFSIKMAALLCAAIMFLIGRHRDSSMSYLMGAAFSIIAVSQAYGFYSDLTLLLDLKPDEMKFFLRSAVSGMVHSAFTFAAAIMCALLYMGMIGIMRRRTMMIFLYVFIAVCILSSYNVGDIVMDLTILLSLCFVHENRSTETKLGKAGRLSITFFPIAAVVAAVLFGIGVMIPVFSFDSEMENAEKWAATVGIAGTVIMAAGAVILLIMILLFPLFLLDKQFSYDAQKTLPKAEDTLK